MNKEMKKFEEVIKRRKIRAKHMRTRKQKHPRGLKDATTRTVVNPYIKKVSWLRRFINWIKHFFV